MEKIFNKWFLRKFIIIKNPGVNIDARGKWVVEKLSQLFVTVAADVISYYIRKWLDSDN